MSTFSFHRVALIFRYDFFSNFRQFRGSAIGLYLALSLGFVFQAFQLHVSDPESVTQLSLFIGGILALVSASHVFNSLNSKTKRINALMLPATNLEKYASYLIEYVVLYHIAFLVLLPLADLTQFVFFFVIANGRADFVTPRVFATIYDFFADQPMGSFGDVLVFLALLAHLSTYVLGSACFRRQPFIFTTLSIMVASIGLSMLITGIGTYLFENHYITERISYCILECLNDKHDLKLLFKIAVYAIPTLWIAFCHWMSYRMFCRASVITSKRFGF